MSIIWADGFDHYATVGQLTDGAYAERPFVQLLATLPRTGGKHINLIENTGCLLRFAFKDGSIPEVGMGYAQHLGALPNEMGNLHTIFADFNNSVQVMTTITTAGYVELRANHMGTLLYTTPVPVIVAGAYQHIEYFVKIHPTDGVFKMNVDGTPVIDLTGIDTQGTALQEVTQIRFRPDSTIGSGFGHQYIDDLYIYDTEGVLNNAFPVGELQCIALVPNADTAEADFTKSTGVDGFALIDELDASDVDYIQAPVVGDRSDFDLTDLDAEITFIAGLFTHTRIFKSDAGGCGIQASMVSSGSVVAGKDRNVTTLGTFWHDVFEKDPSTDTRWTRTGVNAARIRLERTA